MKDDQLKKPPLSTIRQDINGGFLSNLGPDYDIQDAPSA